FVLRRIVKRQSRKIVVNLTPQTRRDGVQYLGQVEVGDDCIVDLEQDPRPINRQTDRRSTADALGCVIHPHLLASYALRKSTPAGRFRNRISSTKDFENEPTFVFHSSRFTARNRSHAQTSNPAARLRSVLTRCAPLSICSTRDTRG